MSQGSPIVPIRVPGPLLALIDAQIRTSNARRAGAPWTRSGFLLAACEEKLAKMRRSRHRRPAGTRRRGHPPQEVRRA